MSLKYDKLAIKSILNYNIKLGFTWNSKSFSYLPNFSTCWVNDHVVEEEPMQPKLGDLKGQHMAYKNQYMEREDMLMKESHSEKKNRSC